MTLPLPSLRPAGIRPPEAILRIAHRGANGAQGYTLASQYRLAAAGAHLLEFDIQVTQDHDLVVSHDPVVVIGSQTWRISDHAMAELCAAGITTLAPPFRDVSSAARAAGLGLYADLKTLTPAAASRLAAILRAEHMTHRTILASHDLKLIGLCAAAAPDLPRAVLIRSTTEDPLRVAASAGAHFVHPCWEHEPRPDQILEGPWLDAVRQQGLGVICWHEERPNIIAALYNLGVDGICTDHPELLLQTLADLNHDAR